MKIKCKDCGEKKEHKAHGLCKRCYARFYYNEPREERIARLEKRILEERGIEMDFSMIGLGAKEHNRVNNMRREARKRALPDTLTIEEAQRIRSIGRCFYCENDFPDNELQLDHFIPISKRGGTTRANMVACCSSCNSSKNNKMPKELLKQLLLA